MEDDPSLPRAFPAGFIYRKGTNEDTVYSEGGQDYATEVSLAYLTLRFRVSYAPPGIEFILPHRTVNFIYHFVNQPDSRLYNLTGMRYLVHPVGREFAADAAEDMGFHEVARSSFAVLRENTQAYPRAFVATEVRLMRASTAPRYITENGRVTAVITAPHEHDYFEAMLAPGVNLRTTAFTEEPVPGWPKMGGPGGSNPTLSSQARITGYFGDHVEVNVDSTGPGFLVLTDTWYPGWEATVNGQPAHIYRTDYLFRGVEVPAGHSVVRLEFRPWSFWVGLWVSILTWLASMALIVALPVRVRST
jgi:hypothetical protein